MREKREYLMKRLVVCVVLCLAATSAALAQEYKVTVTAEKNVNFSRFTTYSWIEGHPSANQRIDARIVDAVDRELAALGMTKAQSGAGDVMVLYRSVGRTDVDVSAKVDAEGNRPQSWVGTLVVELHEPGSRRRLLRLRIDKPIKIEPAALDATIDSAVKEMFAKYPTRQGKK